MVLNKYNMKYLIFFILFQIIEKGALYEEYRKAADKNIDVILGKGELKFIPVESKHEYYSFLAEKSNEKSYVAFSSAMGRMDYFDYMVITDELLTISDIKILKYRSEYGYEISNKGWLKQFYNKPGASFQYKKNIDALSGASFSAQSLVNDLNSILEELKTITMSEVKN